MSVVCIIIIARFDTPTAIRIHRTTTWATSVSCAIKLQFIGVSKSRETIYLEFDFSSSPSPPLSFSLSLCLSKYFMQCALLMCMCVCPWRAMWVRVCTSDTTVVSMSTFMFVHHNQPTHIRASTYTHRIAYTHTKHSTTTISICHHHQRTSIRICV